MTKGELREYAKNEGITLSEARARLAGKSQGGLDTSRDEELNGFVGRDIMPKTAPMGGIMLQSPKGMSNKSEGITSVQVYGPTGELPLFSDNTHRGAGYVATKQMFGTNGMNGWVLAIADATGSEVVITAIKRSKPSADDLARYLITILKNAPKKVQPLIEAVMSRPVATTIKPIEAMGTTVGLVPFIG